MNRFGLRCQLAGMTLSVFAVILAVFVWTGPLPNWVPAAFAAPGAALTFGGIAISHWWPR